MIAAFNALLTAAALLLQTTLAPRLSLAGGRVDFLAAWLCLVACLTDETQPETADRPLSRGRAQALVLGAVAGLVLDLLYGREGLYMLQYTLPAALGFLVCLWRAPRGLGRGMAFAFAVCLLKELPPFLLLYVQRVEMNAGGMLLQAAIGAALSIAWFGLLYFPVRAAQRALDGLLARSESALLLAAKKEAENASPRKVRHRRF